MQTCKFLLLKCYHSQCMIETPLEYINVCHKSEIYVFQRIIVM
jgi:hypothetical protein